MSEILLRQDEANTEGTHVINTADDIEDIINALQVRLGGLESSFKGLTQVAFQDKMTELAATEAQVLAAVRGMGQFLIKAAQTLADVDQEIASSLQ